jgi:hypothetical protein
MKCREPTRRSLVLTALAAGAALGTTKAAADDEDQPGSDERPQKGDLLVFSEGPQAGAVIRPSDLKPGGPPANAWPKDPKTSVIRKGSRLNESFLIHLEPSELDGRPAHAAPTASSAIRSCAPMQDVRSRNG